MNELQQWEEGNKLIGEFMGYRYSKSGKTMRLNNETSPYRLSDIHYHSSWDWLIPVVEKIEAIFDDFHGYFAVIISSNGCTIQGTKLRTDPDNYHPAYFNQVYGETKIEATYAAIIQFIKWYNSQSKTQPQ